MKLFLSVFGLIFLFIGCAVQPLVKNSASRLDETIEAVALMDYLPSDYSMVPSLTIHKGEIWDCDHSVNNSDLACCEKEQRSSVEWKYCLLTDKSLNAFGVISYGGWESRNWTSGKVKLFEKVDQSARWEGMRKKGWSEEVIKAIKGNFCFIGMTEEQVLESKGKPESNNRTRTAESESEQWVYPNNYYVYLTEGVVTSIQD